MQLIRKLATAKDLLRYYLVLVHRFYWTFLKFDEATSRAAEKIKKKAEHFAKLDSILRQDDTGPEPSIDELLAEFEEDEDWTPSTPPAETPPRKPAKAELVHPSSDTPNNRGLPDRIIPAPPAPQAAPSPADPAPIAGTEEESYRLDPADLHLARSRFKKALRLEKEGKVKLAMKYYQEVLDLYPDTPAAIAAGSHLESLRKSRAQKAQRLLARARSLARLASTDEACDDLETVLRKYPDTPEAKIAEKYLSELRSSINKLLK
jgi:tetratricopeptide (TPR) repeat protein